MLCRRPRPGLRSSRDSSAAQRRPRSRGAPHFVAIQLRGPFYRPLRGVAAAAGYRSGYDAPHAAGRPELVPELVSRRWRLAKEHRAAVGATGAQRTGYEGAGAMNKPMLHPPPKVLVTKIG